MVVGRIHLNRSLGSRLRNIAYKPRRQAQIVLDNAYRYRFPAALSGGPFLVRVPPAVGWSVYEAGYSFDTLRLVDVPSPYRIDFFSIPVAARPSARG
jgi:hypothetical protein